MHINIYAQIFTSCLSVCTYKYMYGGMYQVLHIPIMHTYTYTHHAYICINIVYMYTHIVYVYIDATYTHVTYTHIYI